jgi:hypothetical protein
MDDYDGIYNCNDLKYGTYEIFDIFLFISFDGNQNIGAKKTIIKIKIFCSKWYT